MTHSRRYSLAALVGAVLLLLPGSRALAQGSVQLDRGGMDLHMFRPAIDSRGHMTVNGTDVMPENEFSFGLVLDAGFNLLQFDGGINDDGSGTGSRRTDHIVDQMFTGTLMVNFGLLNHAVIGVQVPIQAVNGSAVSVPNFYSFPTLQGGGVLIRGLSYQPIGDLAVHGKVRILRPERDVLGLAVVLRVMFPTGNSRRFAGEPGVSFWPSVIAELRTSPDEDFHNTSRVRFSVEAGVRAGLGTRATFPIYGRTSVDASGEVSTLDDPGTNLRYGPLLTFGAGASFRIARPMDIVIEANGTQILTEFGTPGAFSLEALLGLKLFVQEHSFLMFGGGVGIPTNSEGRGFQAAQFRGVLSFVYEPPVGDRDGDGIMDDIDACPDDPEDFDDFEDEDGCPELDNDRDGIVDELDDCPLIPEDQDGDQDTDGCPEGNDSDRDGDGIPDTEDACPDDPEDIDRFEDEDGCPDPDNDQDGIPDTDDMCPNEAEDIDAFEDEDGCPDLDNDNDRILDVDDQCPEEPENYNGNEDEDGCPDEGMITFEGNSMVVLEKIYFETNSAQIQERSFAILDAIAATLNGNPQIRLIEVQGHADERGSDSHNLRLTQDRAASVVEALAQRGVDRSRLRSAGYGELCPVNPASNRRAWEENRRVEFKIVETDAGPTGVQVACDAARHLVQN